MVDRYGDKTFVAHHAAGNCETNARTVVIEGVVVTNARFQTFVVLLRNHINNTLHRVCAVNRRSTRGQVLDTLYRTDRNQIQVGCTVTAQRISRQTTAVQQNNDVVITETATVEICSTRCLRERLVLVKQVRARKTCCKQKVLNTARTCVLDKLSIVYLYRRNELRIETRNTRSRNGNGLYDLFRHIVALCANQARSQAKA